MNLPQEKTSWIVSSFLSVIGWSVEKNDVVPSAPLSAGTWEEILDITCECLANSGLHVSIDEVTSWHESLGDIHAEDPPLIEDVQGFLKYLKSHGILISVCTSDDRRSTDACLRNWQIEHIVDYSVCGDEVTRAKPSPHPLLELCGRAGVLPEECLVVGDTIADVGMGIHGRAGLVVGVLTGSGTKAQLLDAGAHVVLPNIGHLEDLLRCSLLPRTNSSSAVTTVSLESDESVSAEEKKDDNEQHVASTLVSMKSRGSQDDHLPSQIIEDDEQDDDCWCVSKGDDLFRFDLKSSNQPRDDPPKPMKTEETAQEVGDDDLMFQFDL